MPLVIIVFLVLLVLPLMVGWANGKVRWWAAAAGVPPTLVWWLLAYRDNTGSSDLAAGDQWWVTGVFALLYYLIWIFCLVLGSFVRSAITTSKRHYRT